MFTAAVLAQISPLAPAPTLPSPPAAPPPQEVFIPRSVRPLPGGLDSTLVFNSNSPELVLSPGILLSSFPSQGKRSPSAHLNVAFSGSFELFAHHIAKAATPQDLRTLHVGILVENPGPVPVTVNIVQGASYLSQPDAPFIELPSLVENPLGKVYSGPGSRAMGDIMRGRRQADLPAQVQIPPRSRAILVDLPIPVKTLDPPLNGRSTLLRLWSSGPVYLASLAQFATPQPDGSELPPNLAAWSQILDQGALSSPRDKVPTPLDAKANFIYGRVAGIAAGSRWKAQITDAASPHLAIPAAGQSYSYGISTLVRGRLGTGQDQTAEMLARYPDTAYKTHGNYAMEYNLTLPLVNSTGQAQQVAIALETPIKEDLLSKPGLRFFQPTPKNVFFRGPVRLRYSDDLGRPRTQYMHLVQRRGHQGENLVVLNLPPAQKRLVQVDLLYPPDASPPQVLTVRNLTPP